MAVRPKEASRALAVSRAAVAFAEGRGASIGDLHDLADELTIPYSDLRALQFDSDCCREVENLTRIRAVHLLAYALGPMGEMAKRDPQAFKALAKVAGVKSGPLVQITQAIDARLAEPEGQRKFVERFRQGQRVGLEARLNGSPSVEESG